MQIRFWSSFASSRVRRLLLSRGVVMLDSVCCSLLVLSYAEVDMVTYLNPI